MRAERVQDLGAYSMKLIAPLGGQPVPFTPSSTPRARPHSRSVKWLPGTTVSILLLFQTASVGGQDLAAAGAGLRARERALDRLRVSFDWVLVRPGPEADPFDSRNWSGGWTWRCEMWLVRPHFRWHYALITRSPYGFDRDVYKTWIDGKTMSRNLDPEGTWSVIIDRDRRQLHGPMPILTPFEMQFFDIQDNLRELLERGEVTVSESGGARVVLTGKRKTDDWRVRATLDPGRGWLPIEYHAEQPYVYADGVPRKIDWTMRTLQSSEVAAGIHLVTEAIIVLNNGIDPRWQVYHFTATHVERDEALSKNDLAVPIPRENLRFLDRTTGHSLDTDPRGEVIDEFWKTPEQMEREQQLIAETVLREAEAFNLRLSRPRAFAVIVAGAALAAAVAGAYAWRRQLGPGRPASLARRCRVATLVRWALVLVFAWSAGGKLLWPREFRANLARWALVPQPFTAAIAYGLPALELAVAAALASRCVVIPALSAACFLSLAFTGAHALVLRSGEVVSCGCAGTAISLASRGAHAALGTVTALMAASSLILLLSDSSARSPRGAVGRAG